MSPDTQEAIRSTRGVMIAKYPGYLDKPAGERVVLVMGWLADAVKPRESGANRGVWVERFLDSAGVAPGNPWCASSLTFACKVAEVGHPNGAASVRNWDLWFRKTGHDRDIPQRGDVCMHDSGAGKGHIGIVLKVIGPMVYSIEANTSSGEAGSQRDGDGLYRRVRLKRFWSWGFGRL